MNKNYIFISLWQIKRNLAKPITIHLIPHHQSSIIVFYQSSDYRQGLSTPASELNFKLSRPFSISATELYYLVFSGERFDIFGSTSDPDFGVFRLSRLSAFSLLTYEFASSNFSYNTFKFLASIPCSNSFLTLSPAFNICSLFRLSLKY